VTILPWPSQSGDVRLHRARHLQTESPVLATPVSPQNRPLNIYTPGTDAGKHCWRHSKLLGRSLGRSPAVRPTPLLGIRMYPILQGRGIPRVLSHTGCVNFVSSPCRSSWACWWAGMLDAGDTGCRRPRGAGTHSHSIYLGTEGTGR
jgi:hypothetical protein